jgi:hypothetical protein
MPGTAENGSPVSWKEVSETTPFGQVMPTRERVH